MTEELWAAAVLLCLAAVFAMTWDAEGRGAWLYRALLAAVAAWIVSLSLSGCVSLQEAGESKLDLSRKAISVAEWELCQGASVGAIRERYGVSNDRINAWRRLCADQSSDLFNNQE